MCCDLSQLDQDLLQELRGIAIANIFVVECLQEPEYVERAPRVGSCFDEVQDAMMQLMASEGAREFNPREERRRIESTSSRQSRQRVGIEAIITDDQAQWFATRRAQEKGLQDQRMQFGRVSEQHEHLRFDGDFLWVKRAERRRL